jgi:hypothetical protein
MNMNQEKKFIAYAAGGAALLWGVDAVMDLTVPSGMGGKEALKRILDIDSDAKAIVSAGIQTIRSWPSSGHMASTAC